MPALLQCSKIAQGVARTLGRIASLPGRRGKQAVGSWPHPCALCIRPSRRGP